MTEYKVDLWTRIYNCIAQLARFVTDNAHRFDYLELLSRDDNLTTLQETYNGTLNNVFNILYDENGIIMLLDNPELSMQVEILEKTAGTIISEKNIFAVLKLLQLLDKALENKLRDDALALEMNNIGYLNSNYKEMHIGILPYFHCFWEQDSERRNRSAEINIFADNYIVINLKNLNNIELIHHFYDSRSFINRTDIKIAISPLWNWESIVTEKTIENAQKRINIFHSSDSKKETALIIDKIKMAAKEKVDILVFPELLGNKEMYHGIRAELMKERSSFPKITVLPSVWENGVNSTCIINHYGIKIYEQGKRNPYTDREYYVENLTPYKDLHVMHINGLGRILVMICKDFLIREDLSRILQEVKPTIILIPSYSTGFHDFNRVKGAAEAYECVTVWINSCIQSKPDQPIGFIDKGGHLYDKGEIGSPNLFYCNLKKDEKSKCEHTCLFIETLSLKGR